MKDLVDVRSNAMFLMSYVTLHKSWTFRTRTRYKTCSIQNKNYFIKSFFFSNIAWISVDIAIGRSNYNNYESTLDRWWNNKWGCIDKAYRLSYFVTSNVCLIYRLIHIFWVVHLIDDAFWFNNHEFLAYIITNIIVTTNKRARVEEDRRTKLFVVPISQLRYVL